MSVTNEDNKVNYSATGLSVYTIPFYFSANAHVKLYVNDVLKTLNTHYSVTGAGITSGGVLTFLVTPPTSGVVTIIRDIPLKQENTFNEGGQFSSSTIEGMFDKLTHISQQIDEKTDRAIKMPLSATGLNPQITGNAIPGAILRLSDDGNGLELGLSIAAYGEILDAKVLASQVAKTASEAAKVLSETAKVAAEGFASDSEAAQAAAELAASNSQASAGAAAASALAAAGVFASKTTTDLIEGSNLYHTTSRAQTAAVVNSTTGLETVKAPSVSAMKSYVAANAGGAGGSLTWEKIGESSPENESQDGIKLESFSHVDEQEIYLTLNVPENYVTGSPIKLKNGAFFIDVITNKVLFRTLTALIRPGVTVLGTYSNTHASANSEVTVAGVANTLTAIGELQLSDASGLINGVAVAANDKLRVKLSRKVANETASAASKAKLMINNFDVTFK